MASRGDININEVQPKLFDGWEKLKIEDTLEKAGSFTKLKSKDYFDEGKFPVVDQGDKFISGFVNDEDLLYKGELPVIIFGDHTRNVKYIDFPFATGADGTKVLKPKPFYNPKFYYYYFKSLKVPNLGYSRHFAILKEIDFPIPPLEEQNRIADKLDTLFAQHESIKTRIENLKNISNSLTYSCLTDLKNNKFHDREKIGKYLEEGTDRIGTNWKNLRLIGVSAKEGITDLRIGQKESFEKYKIVRPGDFIYNTMRVNIGSIAIYDGIENALTSPDYVVFRVNKHLSSRLLLNFLKSEQGLLEIGANTKGSVRARLYFKALSEIRMPIAPIKIQNFAENFLKGFNITLNSLSVLKETSLEKLSPSILAKTFKGELVSQLDSDSHTNKLPPPVQDLKGMSIKKNKK
ncbi:hypothetical protein ASE40_13760 [Flavobacterium sp. Root935]|uniref:restriction endonuclease subunit S n=1 Tax=Flavobacterium sp. Root935 TaxID=1736610 RepID=UPI00070E3E48|nr:restriction endonuclease subunit S [Flavobacterium sp. Root935]KRD59243.1 hypothetical protein ASE40_13760 [Flavobacterium sp. Root935]